MAQPPRPKRKSLEQIFGPLPPRQERLNEGPMTLDKYVRQQTGARKSLEEIFGPLPKPSLPSRALAAVGGVLAMPQAVATQTVANLMGIGKTEEEKRALQASAEAFGAASQGLTGQPSFRPKRQSLQPTFEVARGLASIPGEIAKYAAVSYFAGLPAATALGAAEAAGGQAETSLPAMMSRAAGRAGMPRAEQALKRVSESAISRALFDVGAGEAVSRGIQGATAGVRTARQLRGLGDVRVSLDETAAIGTPRPMQVPLIVPSLADAMGLPGRPIPVSRRLPARAGLPEGATLTPSTGVGPQMTAPIAMPERTQAVLPTPPSPRLLPAGAIPQPESWRNQQLREAIQWAEQQRAQRREARFAEEQQARAMPQQGQVRGLLPSETGRQLRYGAMPEPEAPTPTRPVEPPPEAPRAVAPEAAAPATATTGAPTVQPDRVKAIVSQIDAVVYPTPQVKVNTSLGTGPARSKLMRNIGKALANVSDDELRATAIDAWERNARLTGLSAPREKFRNDSVLVEFERRFGVTIDDDNALRKIDALDEAHGYPPPSRVVQDMVEAKASSDDIANVINRMVREWQLKSTEEKLSGPATTGRWPATVERLQGMLTRAGLILKREVDKAGGYPENVPTDIDHPHAIAGHIYDQARDALEAIRAEHYALASQQRKAGRKASRNAPGGPEAAAPGPLPPAGEGMSATQMWSLIRSAKDFKQMSDEELRGLASAAPEALQVVSQRGTSEEWQRLSKLEEEVRRELIARQQARGEPMAYPPPAQPPSAGRPVELPVDRPDVVTFGPQERVPVRYRVVDAASLRPSHNPSTFQPDPSYPRGVQGRNYDTDVAAQRNVESGAQNLDPDPLLDPTITPQSGPPVVTPTGVVVAGNQRSMILRRAIETAPQKYAAYAERLRQNAARYGLTPDDFAGIERPVLVREMDRASDETLATLNRLSDVTQTKAKSPLDDAAARFQALRAAPRPLQTLTEKMSDEETLNAFLDRADGQQFVRELVEDGVIAPQEMGRYLADVDRGVLNEEGKAMVQRMVLLAAVEDPVVISRAPASALQKLEGSAPYIVRSAADEGWNVAPLVRDALSVLSEARDKGLRVPDLLSQVSAFDAPIPPAVQRMALFLSETRPTAVKQAFRRYSTAATEARGQAAYGADMFGNVAESAEQAQARLFGQPRTGMAGAVGMGLGQAGAGAGVAGAQQLAEEEADRQAVIDRMVLYGLMAGGAGMAGYQAYRRIRGAQPPAPPNPAVVTPAMQQVAGTIFRGNRQLPTAPLQQRLVALPPRIKKGLQDFRTQWVEETRPLIRAGREAAGQTGMRQVQEQIAYSHGSLASAKQYLMDRLGPVLKGLTDDQLQAVGVLLKARRENDIQQIYGVRKADVTQTTLAQAIADGEAQPAVKNAADEVNQLFADLLEMRHDAGLLTDEQYFKIVNSEGAYVAYIKELADDIATGGPMGMLAGSQGGFFARATSGVRAMDRTKENIARTLDPLEAAVMATVKTIQDVKKQQVATTVLDLAETANLPWIRQVKGDPTQPLGKFQFKQIRDGKLRLYEVDPQYADFVKAIAGQFTYSQEWYARLLRGWKRLKTAGVTLEPFFQVFNVMRDTIMSGIQRADFQRGMAESAIGAALGGGTGAVFGDEPRDIVTGAAIGAGLGMYARPLTNSLMAFTDIVADRKVYQDFLRNGGSTEGFYVRNADDAHRFIQRMTNGRGVPNVLTPTGWYDVLSFIGSAGEQSTRLAAYKEAREAGLSVGEAVMAAQDRTLRFANRGASSAAKNLASVTPFWNAKMQGWDKLARLLREPKTYAAGTVMITAPSVALWFENKDNPLYWQRPQWERNLFWLVPTPDGQEFVRIPKPFEIGFMFGSSFERVLDYAAQRGLIPSASPTMAEPGAVLARSAMDIATTTGEGTIPVPPIISAPGQLMYDYDIFRNRRIVTRPDLPESMQAQPETSALARQAAQRLGVSPEKVDFALRDVFGTLGAEGSRVLDMAARAAGLPSSEPAGGLPFLGRGSLRFITQNRGQTEAEAAARERLRRLERVDAGYKETRKTADPQAIRQYILDNQSDLLTLRRLREPGAGQRSLVRQLDDLQAMRRRIQQDRRFTPAERKDILARIRLKSADVANKINAMPPAGMAQPSR